MFRHIVSFAFLFFIIASTASAQMKSMTPDVYGSWNRINSPSISNTGKVITYVTKAERARGVLHIYIKENGYTYSFPRAERPQIARLENHVVYRTKEPFERKLTPIHASKKKQEENDTLTVFNIEKKSLEKVSDFNKYELSKKWGNHLIVHLKESEITESDSTSQTGPADPGSSLLVWNLSTGIKDTIHHVKNYTLADESPVLLYEVAEVDSLTQAGVYRREILTGKVATIVSTKGDYKYLVLSEDGNHTACIMDVDTSSASLRPYELWYGSKSQPAIKVADYETIFDDRSLHISHHHKPTFNDQGNRLFFHVAPDPILPDTTWIADETPDVEIWTTQDSRLYTQQKVLLEQEKKKAYLAYFDLESKSIVQLGNSNHPTVLQSKKSSEGNFIGVNEEPYLKYLSWEGNTYADLYSIDSKNGSSHSILKKIPGNVRISPAGKYAYWFHREEQKYYAYDLKSGQLLKPARDISTPLGDEINDRPTEAFSYGLAGWSIGDRYMIIQDRYDLWLVDATCESASKNLTEGRAEKLKYRYIKLDTEEDHIDLSAPMYLYTFNERDKSSGYALRTSDHKIKTLLHSDHRYSPRITKARESNDIFYTRESMEEFPDIIASDLSFSEGNKISEANPQQEDYNWGSGELVSWKNKNGRQETGMLFVPGNFDRNKKYPMIVNFYEKSSDRFYSHRAPYAHRSTINYSYYLSKGYVIFNPDIYYTVGYPGKSALETVVSGTEHILEMGFVDKKRVGLQGHSWGGYQIAHIVTKTDLYACAESGAPVVNMVSAYGGIRWGSGMSRMFQYERTQSRLGATLWENPELYLENSPIFETDKITTPVLILHNDNDGAVPWYQGIEWFVALRRLNKDAWMLNYNGEPHWPLKWGNRYDFQVRMEQFFDHYLMGKKAPPWMGKGIPAIEKKSNLGF